MWSSKAWLEVLKYVVHRVDKTKTQRMTKNATNAFANSFDNIVNLLAYAFDGSNPSPTTSKTREEEPIYPILTVV